MSFFRHLALRHKLTLLSLITTAVAMLLSCGGFLAYELVAFKRDLVSDASIIAEMLGRGAASALSSSNHESVAETLAVLTAQPDIVAACIYDKDGNVFATYPRTRAAAAFGPVQRGPAERFGVERLELFRPIRLQGEEIGTIYLLGDFAATRHRLVRFLMTLGVIMALTILVAYFLAVRLQRIISTPVSELAATVSRIATEKDFSIRATKQGDDELGRLIDGFNDMLGQIQVRDRALQSANDRLEQRVAERTSRLTEASGLLEALLDNSPDLIYFKDRDSRFVRFSKACMTGFGLTKPEELRGKSDYDFYADGFAQPVHSEEQDIIRTGQPIIGKLEKVNYADGRVAWVLTTKMPWRDGTGAIVGIFGISKDVTSLKETEEILAYERDQLRALLDSSPDTIYFKDTESRFVRVSRSKWKKALEHVPDLRARRIARGLSADVPESELLTGLTDYDTYRGADAQSALADEKQIVATGEAIIGKLEKHLFLDGAVRWTLTSKMPWRDHAGKIVGTFGISKDISDLKESEEKLAQLNQQLFATSRQAGMAEVATGVLHNVGNVLNSVNVSATIVADHVRRTKSGNVAKIATLFVQHKADLGAFLTSDARGRMIPEYLGTLAENLTEENTAIITELGHLQKNVEHIKDIVAMQQSYARTSGVLETISVPDLIEDALRMNAGSLARHDVQTVRDYQARPVVTTDKHKVMQILINLVRNAKYACDETGRTDKQILVRTTADLHGVKIAVIDNGVGILAENLDRIFNHGFTTRKHGHGFGLHSGALAARELGGELQVASEGVGKGAAFVLSLPFAPKGDAS